MNATQWLQAHRKTRNGLIWAVVLFVLFNVFCFFIAPTVIRNVAVKKLSEQLRRPVSIEKVFINPYPLTATITGLRIQEADGKEDFVRFDRLYVDLRLMSLFKLAPVVREVTLERPYAHVAREKADRFNFSDIIDAILAETKKSAEAGKPSKPAKFSINNISVTDGLVVYEDRVVGKKHQVTAINVTIPSVSNFLDYIESDVQPSFSANFDGKPLVITGKTKPFAESMETTLDLNLKGLDIPYYLAYSPVQPNGKINSATLTVKAVLKYVQTKKKELQAGVLADVVVTDIDVVGADGKPVCKIPEFRMDGARAEYPSMKCGCQRVLIREPELTVSRARDGSINLLKLLPAPGVAAAPAPVAEGSKPAFATPLVEVAQLQITQAHLSFSDAVNRDPFQTVLAPVDLEVKDFSTADNAKASYVLAMATEAGETVKASGQFSVMPSPVSEGDVEAGMVVLKKYAPYYAGMILFDIADGKCGGGTHYAIALKGKELDARISNAHFAMETLKLVRRGETEPFLTLPSLNVTGVAADLAKSEAVVGDITTTGAELAVQRLKNGRISLQELLPPPVAAAPPAAGTVPVAAAKPWNLTVQHLLLDRYALRLTDLVPVAPAQFIVDQIKVEVKGASTIANAPKGTATISVRINQKATFATDSAFSIAPLAAQATFALKDLELHPFQPYLTDKVKIVLTSGSLSVDGSLDVALPADGKPLVGYKGNVRMAKFDVVGAAKDAGELVKWDAVEVNGIDAKLEPLSVDVAEVVLDKLMGHAIMNAGGKDANGKDLPGRLNVQDLLVQDPAAAPAGGQTDSKSPGATPQSPASAALPIRIAKISFRDCGGAFLDRSITPNYSTGIGSLTGAVSGFALDGSQVGKIDIKGKIDNVTPVTITGKVKPVMADLIVDIHFLLDAMELGGLTPYTGKFLGYRVEKGTLSLDLGYNIVKRKLDSTNVIFFDQFYLGDKVKSPDATGLPVKFALALLRDRKGEIHLDVPVSGSLDDPKFRVFPLIIQVLENLVLKAACSPFALLAGSGGEEMSYVAFGKGSPELDEAAGKKLDTLAKGLVDHPAIKVMVQGHADVEADRTALGQAAFDNKLKVQKLKDLAAQGAKLEDLAATKILPEEFGKYLALAYQQELPPPPVVPPQPKKETATLPAEPVPPPPTAEEMEKVVRASITVSEDELRLLAYNRGLKVREYLIGKAVEAQRLYLLEPRIGASGEAGKPGYVPALCASLDIKKGKDGNPISPEEKDDTPLVVAPPVVPPPVVNPLAPLAPAGQPAALPVDPAVVKVTPVEIKEWSKAAAKGDVNAQYNLGICYSNGYGRPRDPVEAVKWWRLAASQGEIKAQYNLGCCYDVGAGVPQNLAEASRWWRLAANRGLVEAQFNMGNCHAYGKGVAQDLAEAVKWWRLAADQGYVWAQYDLGVCHASGKGVAKDLAEAAKWYRKAAGKGHEESRNALRELEK